MKIFNAKERDSIVAGNTEQHQMTMADSSTLFYLLSEGLYKDTVLAAFREIITNANDAHQENNVKRQIEINQTEGMVTIRDFGGGIPHDNFMNLYGVLGGTTKTDSFVSTGGMGIGKLAPLAMTECFLITNINDGVAKTYTITRASIESNGRPVVSLLNELPSTEESGLLVQIPYQGSTYKVHRAISDIIILGNIPAIFKPYGVQEAIEVKDLNDPLGHVVQGAGELRIKWGHNTYVTPNSVYDHYWDVLNSVYKLYGSSATIILNIPLTESLSITPNREALIDTPRNTEIINNYLKKLNLLMIKALPKFKENALKAVVQASTECSRHRFDSLTSDKPRVTLSEAKDSLFGDENYVSLTKAIEEGKFLFPTDDLPYTYFKTVMPKDYISGWSKKTIEAHQSTYLRNYYANHSTPITDYSKKARRLLAILAKFGVTTRHIKTPFNRSGHVSYFLMIVKKVKFMRSGYTSNVPAKDELYITQLKKTDVEGLKKALKRQLPHLEFVDAVEKKKPVFVAPKKTKSASASFLPLQTYLGVLDKAQLYTHPSGKTSRVFDVLLKPDEVEDSVKFLKTMHGDVTKEELFELFIALMNVTSVGANDTNTINKDTKIGVGFFELSKKEFHFTRYKRTSYMCKKLPSVASILAQQAYMGIPMEAHPLMYSGKSRSIINQFRAIGGLKPINISKKEIEILERINHANENTLIYYFHYHDLKTFIIDDEVDKLPRRPCFGHENLLWNIHTHADVKVFLRIVTNKPVKHQSNYVSIKK